MSHVAVACCCQVNFQKAIEVKQGGQHHIYEKERMGSRKLLEAAMSNDENMVRITDADRCFNHFSDQTFPMFICM